MSEMAYQHNPTEGPQKGAPIFDEISQALGAVNFDKFAFVQSAGNPPALMVDLETGRIEIALARPVQDLLSGQGQMLDFSPVTFSYQAASRWRIQINFSEDPANQIKAEAYKLAQLVVARYQEFFSHTDLAISQVFGKVFYLPKSVQEKIIFSAVSAREGDNGRSITADIALPVAVPPFDAQALLDGSTSFTVEFPNGQKTEQPIPPFRKDAHLWDKTMVRGEIVMNEDPASGQKSMHMRLNARTGLIFFARGPEGSPLSTLFEVLWANASEGKSLPMLSLADCCDLLTFYAPRSSKEVTQFESTLGRAEKALCFLLSEPPPPVESLNEGELVAYVAPQIESKLISFNIFEIGSLARWREESELSHTYPVTVTIKNKQGAKSLKTNLIKRSAVGPIENALLLDGQPGHLTLFSDGARFLNSLQRVDGYDTPEALAFLNGGAHKGISYRFDSGYTILRYTTDDPVSLEYKKTLLRNGHNFIAQFTANDPRLEKVAGQVGDFEIHRTIPRAYPLSFTLPAYYRLPLEWKSLFAELVERCRALSIDDKVTLFARDWVREFPDRAKGLAGF